jgi:hypothetical protein
MKQLLTLVRRFWQVLAEMDSRTAVRPVDQPTRK